MMDLEKKARSVYDTLGTGSLNDVRLIAAALKEAYEAGRASVDLYELADAAGFNLCEGPCGD